jgi:hypothetical protein
MKSEDLAALIVDALYTAGMISEKNLEPAIVIAAEEIEVRKALEAPVFTASSLEKGGVEHTYP